ncbi:hypothetical protein HMPREF9370_0782 [Neisseria wadsworthii 9715]|uniref:Uncharacterized protein n=1 Tax=Neisseria wadsworthii 9715 TaxID=1030841 RepID=G4CNX3_9NEIS|nr:hypothetical protein HMPREF9370_0782 [Neisseria wadsworthii 9715]
MHLYGLENEIASFTFSLNKSNACLKPNTRPHPKKHRPHCNTPRTAYPVILTPDFLHNTSIIHGKTKD